MSDKTDIIYDMLKDMASRQDSDREKASEWREKLSEWTGKTDSRLNGLEKSANNLEDDMKTHIEGVVQNREAIKLNREFCLENRENTDSRLDKLEESKKAWAYNKKWFLGAGTLAAALITILKLLDML